MNTKNQLPNLALIAFLFCLLFITNCTPYYQVPNFDERTADHQTIAILPFEMIFTGKLPKDLTESNISQIKEAEGQAFQISFYHALLRSTRGEKKHIYVDIQPYKRTLRLLEDHGISISDTWDIAPEELAKILNVDAVVQARIEKMRFMSDLDSYGIEVATHIVNIVSDYALVPWIPVSSISKEIIAAYTLSDKRDGITLWSVSSKSAADWRSPSAEIIDEISRRAARKFPYRGIK